VLFIKNSPEQLETKDKIIRAAEQLFSEKGFDGTSVNEIAEKAGVNKPLIYYYFKSKDGLLEFLIDTLLQQTKSIAILQLTQKRLQVIQNNQIQTDGKLKLVNMSENEIDQFLTTSIRNSLDFYLQRRDLLRVIVMESLKKGGRNQHLFGMVDLVKLI
jgi:AcrR family transcriptional regulator